MFKQHLQKVPKGFFPQLVFWSVLITAATIMVVSASPFVIWGGFSMGIKTVKNKLKSLRKK